MTELRRDEMALAMVTEVLALETGTETTRAGENKPAPTETEAGRGAVEQMEEIEDGR